MKIKTYLYDANGKNQEIDFNQSICEKLNEKQLLWINILERKKELIEEVVKSLKFKNAPIKEILNETERPQLDKFENYYRIFINSVRFSEKERLKRVPIDFLVAKNVVISVQDGEVGYFEEFRNLEEGETHIGEMDAESFIATLLDLHVVSYYRAVEVIEQRVDKFDENILVSDLKDEEFFSKMIGLRRDVSKLRKWLMPHRDVFYALSRPDFDRIVNSDSAGHFQHLNHHFEGAVEAVESSRDTVLSLFDLYTTRASHKMNLLIRNLTFATIIFGALSVIAGTFGMNFAAGFFKFESGFWWTILAMGILSIGLIIIAKLKNWL